ncbi:hypothetical protein [Brevundimonas sp.]|uniref:hypothetical protein n=1 Tax=Brevundimonas sp. TaxID=1871086 RepID=UPI00289A594F|nr:hypothetical protein [Brevundimonas sp.]
MRQTGFQQSFNVGELGPDGWSRSDLAQFSKGCILGYNMIGRVVGSTGRRNGTWFTGLPKHADRRSRLIPFRRNRDDALVLEFGHQYVRVWTVNGAPLLNGGVQVEFTSPFTEDLLDGIRFQQSGDVIFLTSRDNFRPRILRRLSNTDWVIEGLEIEHGPFRGENGDPAHTLSLNGSTLTASKPTFAETHVGSLFRLRQNDGNPGVLSWEPEEENIALGVQRLSNGRVYGRSGGANKAGNTPPVHVSGEVSDGSATWAYLHDGAVNLYVTAFASSTSVTVYALGTAPEGLDSGTASWAEGAYSDYRGWPTANPALREERLVLAGNRSEPDVIDLTRTAGFSPRGLDYTPGLGTGRVVDDDAVRRIVGGNRDRVVWMAGSNFLMIGTTDGEFVVSGGSLDDPITPAGCVARPVGEFGSADVMPVLAYGGVLFVAAGGETLREARMEPDQSMARSDLSVMASHIASRGLVELTWLKQPLNLLWVQLADGGQASMTYHAEQQVLGWNRHGLAATTTPTEDEPLGGGMILESSCVVPGYRGRPRLFMIVRREKDGAQQRMILRMADPADKLFLDAAEFYAGDAVNVVAGLDHLRGEAVTVMAGTEAGAKPAPGRGWGEYRNRVVGEDGATALPEGVTAARMQVGLPYLSRFEGLPPEFAGPGTTAGRKVRYTKAAVTLEAAIAEVGTTGLEGDSGVDSLLNRAPGDIGGPMVTRSVWATSLMGGAETERRLFVQTDSGFDMVIHSLRALADVD